MPGLLSASYGIVRFYGRTVGDRDSRGELIRVRLTDSDLARITAIQDHYDRIGTNSSMGRVIAEGVAALYSNLVTEGLVPPNL